MAENSKADSPGFVTTKQAAEMLGVSNHRLYQYVKAGRHAVIRVGKAFMLRVEEVERFRPNPSGRMRTRASSWRLYRSRGHRYPCRGTSSPTTALSGKVASHWAGR